MYDITAFRGVALGADQSIDITIRSQSDFSWESDTRLIERAGRFPMYESTQPFPRRQSVQIRPGTGAPADYEDWREEVLALLNPYNGRGTLQISYDGVTLETEATITLLSQRPDVPIRSDRPGMLDAVLTIEDPIWRAATPATVSASPYTPGGNYPAQPVITYSRSSTGNWVDVTITDTTGNGLSNHLVMIGGGKANAGGNFNTSGVSASAASNFIVYAGGRPVPFIVLNPGHATLTAVFVRVNVLPGASEVVRILWASSISNTITANKLDPAGMDLANSSFDNATWIWLNAATTVGGQTAPAIWQLSGQPTRVPGAWYPDTTNFHAAGDVFNILENSASVQIGWGEGQGAVVADSMVLSTGGVRVASGLVMQGFSVVLDTDPEDWPEGMMLPIGGTSGGGASTYETGTVRFLTADARTYLPATFTDPDFDVTGAISVAIGPNKNRLLTVSEHATDDPMRIALNTSDIPTVSIGTPAAIVHASFTLTNSTLDQSVQVSDVFFADADGDLVIDTRTREITPEDLLWQDDEDGISFSERFGKFEFQHDTANTYALSGSGSVAMEAADRYVL